ncbi:MAG: metallophosphoesterase [Bdellovibrionota bacterium]
MKRRQLKFLLFFPALLAPAYVYLSFRLGQGAPGWVAMALPFFCVLVFPFLVIRRGRGGASSAAERFVSKLAYLNMGLVSFLLVAFLARDLLGLVAGRWVSPGLALGFSFAMLAIASYLGFFGPGVRKVTVTLPGLPAALRGLKIAQISDLHLSSHIGLKYVERVVSRTRALGADVIALTGDIGDGHARELGPEIEALRGLHGEAPIFFVTGNHEVYWNFEEWLGVFRGLGMKVLLNAGETFLFRGAEIFVGGITDPACAVVGMPPDLLATSVGSDGAALKILLSHRPDPADAAAAAGFDLQLSGHTHGGQFVPWTIVAGLVHRYSLGLYRIGKMFIYVSAGTGSWGPRLRLGTTAEITLLELA